MGLSGALVQIMRQPGYPCIKFSRVKHIQTPVYARITKTRQKCKDLHGVNAKHFAYPSEPLWIPSAQRSQKAAANLKILKTWWCSLNLTKSLSAWTMSWYPNLTLAIIPTREHILILFYPSPSAKSKIIPWHSHPGATFIICRRRFYSFALSLVILGLGMIMDDHSQAWNQQLVGGIPTPLKNISQIGSSSQLLRKIKHVPNHQPDKYSTTSIWNHQHHPLWFWPNRTSAPFSGSKKGTFYRHSWLSSFTYILCEAW